jgi:hypothetical protein
MQPADELHILFPGLFYVNPLGIFLPAHLAVNRDQFGRVRRRHVHEPVDLALGDVDEIPRLGDRFLLGMIGSEEDLQHPLQDVPEGVRFYMGVSLVSPAGGNNALGHRVPDMGDRRPVDPLPDAEGRLVLGVLVCLRRAYDLDHLVPPRICLIVGDVVYSVLRPSLWSSASSLAISDDS